MSLCQINKKNKGYPMFKPSKKDIENFIQLERKIVKIQALCRRINTKNRLKKMSEQTIKKISNNQFATPEEAALSQFAYQCKSKNLTPEAFFRICDIHGTRSVSKSAFLAGLQSLKFKLTHTQQQRLILILDEDMTGAINLYEFNDALESLNLDRETHQDPRNEQYQSIKALSIDFLLKILQENQLSLEQFATRLENKSNQIDLSEMRKQLQKMAPNIQIKILTALQTYLNINKRGSISKQQFLSLINSPVITSVHDAEPLDQGDQAAVPKISRQYKPKPAKSALQVVKEQIDASGTSPSEIFELASNQTNIVECFKLYIQIQKSVKNIDKDAAKEVMRLLGEPKQNIDIQTWLSIFGDKHPSPPEKASNNKLNLPNEQHQSLAPINPYQHLKLLADAITQKGHEVIKVWKKTDHDNDGKIYPKDFDKMQAYYLGNRLSTTDLQALMTLFHLENGAMSVNELGRVMSQFFSSSQQQVLLNYSEFSSQETVDAIEQTLREDITEVFADFWEQDSVPVSQITRVLSKMPNPVSMELIDHFLDLIEADNTNSVEVKNIVRVVQKCQGKNMDRQTLNLLSQQIGTPLRQQLSSIFTSDAITQEEFVDAFRECKDVSIWQLVCLYQNLRGVSMTLQIQNLTKLLEKASVPSLPPTNLNSSNTRGQNSSTPREGTILNLNREMFAQQIKIDSQLKNQKISDVAVDQELPKVDFVPSEDRGCIVNNGVALKQISLFWAVSDLVQSEEYIGRTVLNTIKWIENQQEEHFFTKEFSKIQDKHKKNLQEIAEFNILMLRVALSKASNSLNFKRSQGFTPLECILLQLLMTEQNAINKLEMDIEFIKQFMKLAAENIIYEDKENWDRYISMLHQRIARRIDLIKPIMVQSLQSSTELDITNNDVWNRVRFSKLSYQIICALKDQTLKQKFIQKFGSKERISYFNLQKLMQSYGVQDVSEWLLEDFYLYLDKQEESYIQLSEFAEHLKLYDFELLEKKTKLQSDMKQKFLESTLKYNPKQVSDYQISQSDYYRDCPTIFTSELAALKYASELFDKLPDEAEWDDPDFGPTQKDPRGLFSLFNTGEMPDRYPYTEVEALEWERPDNVIQVDTKNIKTPFIQDDASANEVIQGKLANCWFVSALSVLATQDELIRGGGNWAIQQSIKKIDYWTATVVSSGVYPPIFHKFRKKKIFVLRFFKDFDWKYVVIDDKIPYSNKEVLYAKCKSEREMWAPLIEKAYAKLFGTYESLESGMIDDAIADMTGYTCERILMHDKYEEFCLDKELLWQQMKEYAQNRSLMGCSRSGGGREAMLYLDGEASGILRGHAYSVSRLFELKDENMENPRKTHRIMIVRNPHGETEWNLKWGKDSEQIDNFETQLNQEVAKLEHEEQFNLRDDDGTFFINFQSFREAYDKLFIAQNFADDWCAIRYESEWTDETSGGLPIENTQEAKDRYAKNPQYYFEAEQDCELFVSLAQMDGRVNHPGKQVSKYPFTDRVNCVHLAIWELEDGSGCVKSYTKPLLVSGRPKAANFVTLRANLKAGHRYCIIPTVRKAGDTGKFYLSLYFDEALHRINTYRIDSPLEQHKYVKEELERTQRQVPEWKEKWIADQITNEVFIVSQDRFHRPDMSMSMTQSRMSFSGMTRSSRALAKRQSLQILKARQGKAIKDKFSR